MIEIPRLVIAGTHSGVGKTTVATALMAAFTRRGLRVQPFKVGPDFIDPGFHEAACGRVSRNLDGWMLSRDANLQTFARAAAGADLALIEGVMGLFDGRAADGEEGSTAEMAKWLASPVVLVADASAMARSAAALVHGFETFDRDLDVAGVICNSIGGEGHAALLRQALGGCCRAKPLGFLPRCEAIALPSRHLGLVMAGEALEAGSLERMAAWVERHVDLDGVMELARTRARALEEPGGCGISAPRARIRIGVARDAAFCFYYRDNLDLLAENGAELVEFSPITDRELPAGISGLYLGGGYPEIHAAALSANQPMLAAIRKFAEAGGPVYAECGGFMYLTEAIVDGAGQEHRMTGIFPTRARLQPQLAALGYLEVETPDGLRVRGHEFRYSEIDPMPPDVRRSFVLHGNGASRGEGYTIGRVLAGYAHLHFGSEPRFAARLVESWERRRFGCGE